MHAEPMRKAIRSGWILGLSVLAGFLILGFFGREIYRKAPPIPERAIGAAGQLVTTKEEILTGQQVWQSTGGQQLGSIWGHGAYQAPDWSADWLHREAVTLMNILAEEEGAASFGELPADRAAVIRDGV